MTTNKLETNIFNSGKICTRVESMHTYNILFTPTWSSLHYTGYLNLACKDQAGRSLVCNVWFLNLLVWVSVFFFSGSDFLGVPVIFNQS